MRFKDCRDFVRRGKFLLLTPVGIERIRKIKLTGTKIAKFFKIDEEDRTPFAIWADIFNFPWRRWRNPQKAIQIRDYEDLIRSYLGTTLGKKFLSYPPGKYDVFGAEIFGGVPDGEEMGERGEVISILEIKTTSLRSVDFSISYLLQLSLYLYLRNLDTGYLCVCYVDKGAGQATLGGPLIPQDHPPRVFKMTLDSYVDDVGSCPFSYEILQTLSNDHGKYTPLLLHRIRIDLSLYGDILNRLGSWFHDHRHISPELTDAEINRLDL